MSASRHYARPVTPDTLYTMLDGQRIAYQVYGEGPDLVFGTGSFGHTDAIWEDPAASLFLSGLGEFARVIRFDRRGSSNSDPVLPDSTPPWESYTHELSAVMEAAGSERAVLVAALDSGPASLIFAASNPERLNGVVLYNTGACFVSSEEYPIGMPREQLSAMFDMISAGWGTEELVDMMVPFRAGDARFRSWYAKFQRAVGTPTTVRTAFQSFLELDARPFLETISTPALVMHRRDFAALPIALGRYLAEQLGTTLVEIPGSDGTFYWETPDLILDHISRFVADVTEGSRPSRLERLMATILFTDIVKSTEFVGRVGDRNWSRVLDLHDEVSRAVVEEQGGRLVKGTGDGILALFTSPTRAVKAAVELGGRLESTGIQIRAGLHSGEIEQRGEDVSGVAVHLASRIMDRAGAGEVLASRTVRDLVTGSGLAFEDRDVHTLKGISEPWHLYGVVASG